MWQLFTVVLLMWKETLNQNYPKISLVFTVDPNQDLEAKPEIIKKITLLVIL